MQVDAGFYLKTYKLIQGVPILEIYTNYTKNPQTIVKAANDNLLRQYHFIKHWIIQLYLSNIIKCVSKTQLKKGFVDIF